MPAYIKVDKYELIKYYSELRLSMFEIAEKLNISNSTIHYKLREYNIPFRGQIGKVVSEATKQKMSRAKIGRPSPFLGKTLSDIVKDVDSAKLKMSLAGRGRNKRSHLKEWDGSKTPRHHKFLTSAPWKETRSKVFERDNYICQLSGIRGGDLECHHIIPKHLLPEDRWLDMSNLITLSKTSHKQTKGKENLFQKQFFQNLIDRKIIDTVTAYTYES